MGMDEKQTFEAASETADVKLKRYHHKVYRPEYKLLIDINVVSLENAQETGKRLMDMINNELEERGKIAPDTYTETDMGADADADPAL